MNKRIKYTIAGVVGLLVLLMLIGYIAPTEQESGQEIMDEIDRINEGIK